MEDISLLIYFIISIKTSSLTASNNNEKITIKFSNSFFDKEGFTNTVAQMVGGNNG